MVVLKKKGVSTVNPQHGSGAGLLMAGQGRDLVP